MFLHPLFEYASVSGPNISCAVRLQNALFGMSMGIVLQGLRISACWARRDLRTRNEPARVSNSYSHVPFGFNRGRKILIFAAISQHLSRNTTPADSNGLGPRFQ